MIHLMGMRVVEVPDFQEVERSFWERWFTLPWTPKVRKKRVPHMLAAMLGDGIIVSQATNTIYARPAQVRELKRLQCEMHP